MRHVGASFVGRNGLPKRSRNSIICQPYSARKSPLSVQPAASDDTGAGLATAYQAGGSEGADFLTGFFAGLLSGGETEARLGGGD